MDLKPLLFLPLAIQVVDRGLQCEQVLCPSLVINLSDPLNDPSHRARRHYLL